jgi:hypothetical protein
MLDSRRKSGARLHFMGPKEFFTVLEVPGTRFQGSQGGGGYKVKKYRPAEGKAPTRKSEAVSELLLKSLNEEDEEGLA